MFLRPVTWYEPYPKRFIFTWLFSVDDDFSEEDELSDCDETVTESPASDACCEEPLNRDVIST